MWKTLKHRTKKQKNELEPDSKEWSCNTFRVQYERKKIRQQRTRYKEALYDAQVRATRQMSDRDIEAIAVESLDQIINKKGRVDINKLMVALADRDVHIGKNKAYRIKAGVEAHNKELIVQVTRKFFPPPI